MSEQVAIDEIIEALSEAWDCPTVPKFKPLIDDIKAHGIAPPDGWVLVPVNTLEQWSALLSEGRYRRPLWEIETMLSVVKEKE